MGRERLVVVITGASSGIGRATALAFAKKRKASLVLASRRKAALGGLAEECRRLGSTAIGVETEVASEEAVDLLADAAVRRFGRIDVWVNNASVMVYAPFLEIPMDDFRRVLDVNLMGYVYGSHAALRTMTAQGRGVLINIASVLGEIPQPYSAPYGMAKAAVRALGVILRSELLLAREKHVSVSTVSPASMDTPIFQNAANYTGREVKALPPVYPPEMVARQIVRLVRHPQAEVVVGAGGKALSAQHRLTPQAVEDYIAWHTEVTQFQNDSPASASQGNLYRPGRAATVRGGWGGSRKSARRRLIRWGLTLTGAWLMLTKLLRH